MEIMKTFLIFAISVAKAQHWFAATDFLNQSIFESNSSSDPRGSLNFRPNVQEEENHILPIVGAENHKSVATKLHLAKKIEKETNHDGRLNSGEIDGPKFNYMQDYEIRSPNSTTPTKFFNGVRRRMCHAAMRRKHKSFRHPKAEGKSRFLEVFQVVKFDNGPCSASSGLEGTCLHQYECETSGGVVVGICADGYGSCCVMQASCGDTTASAAVWFTNPGFPLPSIERLSCALTLDKASERVRQIRLDLTTFELLPPTEGSCEQDQFVVSGHNINSFVPILCGINNGQHLYIEVGDVPGPIYLSVQTVTGDSRLFAIKMTQLTGSEELAVPPGCLQYYTGKQGVLESFLYQDKSALAIGKNPSYLNNMNYAMCIQRAADTCSITYTNDDVFHIPNYDTDGLPVIPAEQAGVEIFNCPSDWVILAAARLCGERLNDGSVLQDFALDAPVTDSTAGPIVVWFRSDSGGVGRGFRLQYSQNACTSRSKRDVGRASGNLKQSAGRTVVLTLFIAIWQVISAYLKFLLLSLRFV